MGSSSWSNDAFDKLRANHSTKSKAQIFSNLTLDIDLSPRGVQFRESRDSEAHPDSLAIAVFLDETGSMGMIPEVLVREKLGALMTTLIAHSVPDAHVLFGGIGDHYSDQAPLQVGQFEAGTTELNQWLTKIYLEGNGGGQCKESYLLAWLFAARHTSIDCFEKRGEKGFLFTIGDEANWDKLESNRLKDLMGYEFGEDVSADQLLSEAQRMYHVFHLHINETGYRNNPTIINGWRQQLGERLLIVEDHQTIAETIASTVAVVRGASLDKVVASFDKATAKKVTQSLIKLGSNVPARKRLGGIFKL